MDECGKCYKFERCFERRGICTEYRSTEAIRQEIEAVMQSCKASKAEYRSTEAIRQEIEAVMQSCKASKAESTKGKASEKGRADSRREDKN